MNQKKYLIKLRFYDRWMIFNKMSILITTSHVMLII